MKIEYSFNGYLSISAVLVFCNHMDKRFLLLAIFVCFFAIAAPVMAHLPYMAEDNTGITVDKPEISKAYYGWLQGEEAVYSIDSAKPFLLYLNLLSPQVDGGRQDFSAKVYKNDELLATLNGGDTIWLVTYEPFANDYYIKGPEYEARAVAGNYKIEVYNSGNSGNYVLAVGKTEDLSPGQFLRTLAVLPKVKQDFFGKAWWEAYNNLVGLAAFVIIVLLAIAIYFAVSTIKIRRLKARLDNEYGKYQNNRSAR